MTSAAVELCETEVCFLHIQLIGTIVWLPKMHNVPPEVDFESSTSPAKSESWNSPKSASFGSASHVTTLLQFTCVMNIWNQSILAFVTRFRPFCQSTCKLVHKPLNIGSTNTSQVKTFHNNLWAYCRQLSYWLLFFIFKLMVIHVRCRDCIICESFYSKVRNIFPRISLRDLPCHRTWKILFLHQVPWSSCG